MGVLCIPYIAVNALNVTNNEMFFKIEYDHYREKFIHKINYVDAALFIIDYCENGGKSKW